MDVDKKAYQVRVFFTLSRTRHLLLVPDFVLIFFNSVNDMLYVGIDSQSGLRSVNSYQVPCTWYVWNTLVSMKQMTTLYVVLDSHRSTHSIHFRVHSFEEYEKK